MQNSALSPNLQARFPPSLGQVANELNAVVYAPSAPFNGHVPSYFSSSRYLWSLPTFLIFVLMLSSLRTCSSKDLLYVVYGRTSVNGLVLLRLSRPNKTEYQDGKA